MINVTNLRTFWMVARTGSFRAASEELNVSQPALTRQVKDLELTYGVTLLNRTGNGSVPTEAGKQLFERADTIFQLLKQTESFLRHKQAGSLSLHSVSHVTLSKIVSSLKGAFSVPVEVTMAPSLDVEQALLEEKCDIGLLTLDHGEREEIERRLIGMFDMLCIVPPKHHLASQSKISVNDLDQERVIIGTPRTQTRKHFDVQMQKYRIAPQIIFEVNCRFTLTRIAHEMNAIGIYSDTGFSRDVFENSRPFAESDMALPVHLAAHRSRLRHSLSDAAFRHVSHMVSQGL